MAVKPQGVGVKPVLQSTAEILLVLFLLRLELVLQNTAEELVLQSTIR